MRRGRHLRDEATARWAARQPCFPPGPSQANMCAHARGLHRGEWRPVWRGLHARAHPEESSSCSDMASCRLYAAHGDPPVAHARMPGRQPRSNIVVLLAGGGLPRHPCSDVRPHRLPANPPRVLPPPVRLRPPQPHRGEDASLAGQS
jgi:hypothetical protein